MAIPTLADVLFALPTAVGIGLAGALLSGAIPALASLFDRRRPR